MPPQRRNNSRQFRNLSRELRQSPNHIEAVVWHVLRNGRLRGIKFRRQHPIGRYIVDFYCPAARVVVELDGATHQGREAYDAIRQKWLESQDLLVIRCPNEELTDGIDELLELIWKRCSERIAGNTPSPNQ